MTKVTQANCPHEHTYEKDTPAWFGIVKEKVCINCNKKLGVRWVKYPKKQII